MPSRFHTILVELAFEIILGEINGQVWPCTLHGNTVGLKNNRVDLDKFCIQNQVQIEKWCFPKWLYSLTDLPFSRKK